MQFTHRTPRPGKNNGKKTPSIQSIIRSKNPEHAGLSQAVKTCRTQVQHTINNKEHISDPTSEERGIYSQGTR